MPIPVINYAGLPAAETGIADLTSNIGKGLSAYFLPKTLKEDLKKQQLANALSQLNLQYTPAMNQAELEYKQAQLPDLQSQTNFRNEQTKYYGDEKLADIAYKNAHIPLLSAQATEALFKAKNPLLQLPGAAGQIGAIAYIRNHPEQFSNNPTNLPGQSPAHNMMSQMFPEPKNTITPEGREISSAPNLGSALTHNPSVQDQIPSDNFQKMITDSLTSNIRNQNANANLNEQRSKMYAFKSLPVEQRKTLLAQAAGMGIEPQEAQKKFSEGYTIEDLAKEKRIDPNNLPTPIYGATATDINRMHQRGAGIEELNVLDDFTAEAISPYSQRFDGYSPKEIWDSIRGENEDQKIQFLAAAFMVPEIAALRLKIMNGQAGIEAINEITNSSMNRIKISGLDITPHQYEMASKLMNSKIKEAANQANKYLSTRNSNQGNKDKESMEETLQLSNEDIQKIKSLGIAQEDLEHTAKKYGKSARQVLHDLGAK